MTSKKSAMCSCVICKKEYSAKGIHTHHKISHTEGGSENHKKRINASVNKSKEQRSKTLSVENAARKSQYEKSPKHCLCCGNVLHYDARGKKFCDRSCSATHNNKKRGERSEYTKQILSASLSGRKINNKKICRVSFCKSCGTVIKNAHRVFCSDICTSKNEKRKNKFDGKVDVAYRRAKTLIECVNKLLLTDIVNEHTVAIVKVKLQELIDSGMSPNDIKVLYGFKLANFTSFCKGIGLKTRSSKDALANYHVKRNTRSDDKMVYRNECRFNFNPYEFKEIPGYDNLIKYGIYHPTKNPGGVTRDHIVSVEYGWRNNIDSNVISNPSNCQFLTNKENARKGTDSWITIETLLERISRNDFGEFVLEKVTI